MKTAVEWFANIISQSGPITEDDFDSLVKQAKEMEKKQIVDAFDEGQEYEYQYHINSAPKFDSEKYYNETFKQ